MTLGESLAANDASTCGSRPRLRFVIAYAVPESVLNVRPGIPLPAARAIIPL